ncbi:hypothetical protein [Embleya sp. NBC_00896]|uniref:hypothetical protein n=1 Tax=Embleya sp. NBC_00896 TaxID=2975961 RepID=UPI002F915FF4|nr:hypothetical protein OG928_44005 [Embleya sp. NBC_00896]
MAFDPELLGLWDSGPYDLGSMENSQVAFLADGDGWTLWHNAAGGQSVAAFRWSCPEPNTLVMREKWSAEGVWRGEEPAGWRTLSLSDGPPAVTRYWVNPVTVVRGMGPFVGVRFRDPVEGTRGYKLLERTVTAQDCPAYELVAAPLPPQIRAATTTGP